MLVARSRLAVEGCSMRRAVLVMTQRQERSARSRLELFHAADRMAVSDQVALIRLPTDAAPPSSDPRSMAGGSSARAPPRSQT